MKLQEIQAKLEERGETELVATVQEIVATLSIKAQKAVRQKAALLSNKAQKAAAIKAANLIQEHFKYNKAQTWDAPLLQEVKVKIESGGSAFIIVNFNEAHVEFDKALAYKIIRKAGLTPLKGTWFTHEYYPEGNQVQIHFDYNTYYVEKDEVYSS